MSRCVNLWVWLNCGLGKVVGGVVGRWVVVCSVLVSVRVMCWWLVVLGWMGLL